MSFFFPNIDGCEALLSARQPERKTSSNSKDSTNKLNLVLCWSWSCETLVWWICTRRMNWFCKKILSKWTMQYTNDTFHTHTLVVFCSLNWISSYSWLLRHWRTLRDLDMEFPWHKTLREEEASERGPWQRKPWERGSWERERWYSRWRANKSYKNKPWAVSAAWKNLTVSSQDWAKHPYTW